jgi:IS605 OrfB family transposase
VRLAALDGHLESVLANDSLDHPIALPWTAAQHLQFVQFIQHLVLLLDFTNEKWYTACMKLIAQVKLQPTEEQADGLRDTFLAWSNAANYISDQAWMRKSFRKYDLHHATYYEIRERFGLAAQAAIRVIAVVADAYKLDKRTKRTFRKMGAMTYDNRILTWNLEKSTVSIWTIDGRIRDMPFVCGDRQRKMLESLQGEADITFRNGDYYINQTCNIVEDDEFDPDGFLGVDMGLVNVATDSDGNNHSGAQMLSMRKRRRRQRKRLQSKGTKSAKRVLRRLSGKEQRFATNENHRISKEIVNHAKRTGQGIALEDLKGIRGRVRLRRKQRTDLHSWSFGQLQRFIGYKAQLVGVPVMHVNPAYTSQTCSCCGHISRSNRKSQSFFKCVSCGFAANADKNAAVNIGRAAVNQPHGSVNPRDQVQAPLL